MNNVTKVLDATEQAENRKTEYVREAFVAYHNPMNDSEEVYENYRAGAASLMSDSEFDLLWDGVALTSEINIDN